MTWRLLLPAAAAALVSAASGCGGGSAAPGDDAASACTPIDSPMTCPANPPSYKNEIQYVVANTCAQAKCHAPGGAVSVHDFTTYQGVFGDHITFAEQVSMCLMPPAGYPQPSPAQRLDLITWAGICKAPNN